QVVIRCAFHVALAVHGEYADQALPSAAIAEMATVEELGCRIAPAAGLGLHADAAEVLQHPGPKVAVMVAFAEDDAVRLPLVHRRSLSMCSRAKSTSSPERRKDLSSPSLR